MNQLVFVPVNPTSYSEMMPLAKALTSNYEIIFFVDNAFVRDRVPEIEAAGFRHFSTWLEQDGTSILRRKLSTAVLMLTSFSLERFLKRKYRRNFRRQTKRLEAFFQQYTKVQAAFVYGDRHASTIELPLIAEAKRRNVTTIIPPLAFFSREQNLLAQRRLDDQCDWPASWQGQSRYEGLSRFDKVSGKKILYYEKWMIEALDEIGALPKNPWVMGGGDSSYIWCDSENAKNFLVSDGCEASKIRVTGHLAHDDLFKAKAQPIDLKAYPHYQADRKNVVVALPQLGEHELLPWPDHWREVEFLFATLQGLNANIFVSLHPKMKDPKYFALARQYKADILTARLKEALPIADIYTSTFSSTVPWALALRLPCVIFDFYGLNYDFYENDGLEVFKDKMKYAAHLQWLMASDENRKAEGSRLEKIATKYPRIDGQVHRRVLEQLSALLSAKS